MTTVPVRAEPRGRPRRGHRPDPHRRRGAHVPRRRRHPINGYLARPAAAGRARPPAMIVIHEAGGLGEHIRDVTNRFANLGYVALGVDLYTREGGPPPMDDMQAMMRAPVLDVRRDRARRPRGRRRLPARARGLHRQGRLHRLLHGRALHAAVRRAPATASTPPSTAGAGSSTKPPRRSLHARAPHAAARARRQLRCPLLAAIGAEDHNPSPEIGEQLRERAAASGQEVKVDVYEGAGHAFFADYRPSYRPEPAAQAVASRSCRSSHAHLRPAPERPRRRQARSDPAGRERPFI